MIPRRVWSGDHLFVRFHGAGPKRAGRTLRRGLAVRGAAPAFHRPKRKRRATAEAAR